MFKHICFEVSQDLPEVFVELLTTHIGIHNEICFQTAYKLMKKNYYRPR